jgi:hypothetical protein
VFTISDVVLITFCLLRFSANDLSVQPEFHGGYLAFTLPVILMSLVFLIMEFDKNKNFHLL